jgi:hypothetical protein
MKKLLFTMLLVISLLGGGMSLSTATASAAVAPECDGSGSFLFFPTWYRYLDISFVDGSCQINLPEDSLGNTDWQQVLPRVGLAAIDILLRVGTIVAIGFVMYGGFRYITSQGEPDGTKAARQTILNAVIGLIITLLATGIVAFAANVLTGTNSSTAPNAAPRNA